MIEQLRAEIIKRVDACLEAGWKLNPKIMRWERQRVGCLLGLCYGPEPADRKICFDFNLTRLSNELQTTTPALMAIEAGFCRWSTLRGSAAPEYAQLGRELREHYAAVIE